MGTAEKPTSAELEREYPLLLNFSFIRHGEPERYGVAGSHLSLNGRAQVRNIARSFSLELIQRGEPAEIWGGHSGQERTKESLDEYYGEIRKNLLDHPEMAVFEPRLVRALNVTRPLHDLEEQGIPTEAVYATWLTDDESVDQVARYLKDVLRRTNKRLVALDPKTKLYFPLITHEPFFGASLRTLFPSQNPFPEYCEVLQIGTNGNGKFRFEFRGEVVWRNF